MIITKKYHKELLEKALADQKRIHDLQVETLKESHAKEKLLFSDFIERANKWIRVHGYENRGPLGKRLHTYTVRTEFTAEFLHYGMGGSHQMARMITNELAESGYLALVALCHLDQPPALYERRVPEIIDETL